MVHSKWKKKQLPDVFGIESQVVKAGSYTFNLQQIQKSCLETIHTASLD